MCHSLRNRQKGGIPVRFLQRPLPGRGRSWIGGACLAAVGASGLLQPASPVAAAGGLPAFDHVFVVVMENRDHSHVLGDTVNSPYVNSLAARYGVATNYYAVGRPSLPNYLALTGATTFGTTTDCTDCFVPAPNIAVDRVEASGRTWKAYMESMPGPCFVGDSYPYMQKHDPFFYYDDIRTNPAECARVVPYTSLSSDLASAATTPNFVWVTPNMCDDTHDCPVATGDQWLSQNIPLILSSPAFTTQSSALFLTWDEGDDSSPNQVPMLVVSRQVPAGFRSSLPATHYSLLKTIEAAWDLAPLGVADRPPSR